MNTDVTTSERAFLKKRLAEKHLSARAASLAIGKSHAFVRNYLEQNRPRRISLEDSIKLARLLDCRPADLLPPGALDPGAFTFMPNVRSGEVLPDLSHVPLDLPVRGTAEGSLHGSFELGGEVVEYIRRPPPLVGVPDSYAIYVVGTSMSPAFDPGDPAFVHPRRQPRAGDYCVVQVRKDENAPLFAYLKRMVSMNDDWVVLEQFNPPARMKIARNTIVAVHRVLRPGEVMRT